MKEQKGIIERGDNMSKPKFNERFMINYLYADRHCDVYKYSNDKQIKLKTDKWGYKIVSLVVDKVQYYCMLHRLIWQQIFGDIPEGYEINHKNLIKDDNRIINLELVTHSNNMIHAVANGVKIGNHNPTSPKLTIEEVREIKIRLLDGEEASDIYEDYDVARTTISNIKYGTTWKNVVI